MFNGILWANFLQAEREEQKQMSKSIAVSRKTFNELRLALGTTSSNNHTRLFIGDLKTIICDDEKIFRSVRSIPCCDCGEETINEINHQCKGNRMTREEAYKQLANSQSDKPITTNDISFSVFCDYVEALGLIKFDEEKPKPEQELKTLKFYYHEANVDGDGMNIKITDMISALKLMGYKVEKANVAAR